jgi:hypothetical protein
MKTIGGTQMTNRTNESSTATIKVAARQAGALYLLFSIVSILTEFFGPAFIVLGDATTTARNITAGELAYRFGILSGFVNLIIFIFLVVTLYNLLKDVDKKHAMLMVLFVALGVGISLVNLINKFAPLILMSGADYLSVFTKAQLDALSLGFLRLHSNGLNVVTVFWGLWLFPFGILVFKSGFFPRILGILLILAGFAYLTVSFTSIALPAYLPVVSQVMTPLYFGEIPIIFWLLIKGAKAPLPEAGLSHTR